jgi:membrane associated rhomboid family serine protease
MLEDRDYMRQSSGRLRWSATLTLVVVLVVAYLVQRYFLSESIYDQLALSLEGIKSGHVWELLTFQFLHGGWLHLFFNCFTLYMFGREVESTLGKVRFLILYFASGIVGGLFQVLAFLLWPHYFAYTIMGAPIAVVGASAGVFGVVAAFAMLAPNEMLTMLVFFVLPVNLRAKWLLVFSLVVTALGIAFPVQFGGNVAHAAHLGGILTGMAFIRFGGELSRSFLEPFESRRRKRELIKAMSIKIPQWPRPKSESPHEVTEEEFISREVDPILDKISQHGIQSLTERERKILEAARNRMAKK